MCRPEALEAGGLWRSAAGVGTRHRFSQQHAGCRQPRCRRRADTLLQQALDVAGTALARAESYAEALRRCERLLQLRRRGNTFAAVSKKCAGLSIALLVVREQDRKS